MLTVGRLAKRSGLSRSTLLYYERIGLLRASGRSQSNYRLYTEDDAERLARIVAFRRAGVPLDDIGAILETDTAGVRSALEARLGAIDEEMDSLREQQRVIAKLLQDGSVLRRTRSLDKAGWIAVLRAAGMSDADMRRWHAAFERSNPHAHGDFLRSLGIDESEVDAIRARARRGAR